MDLFIQASQFILSLSLLIVLHELGHFIPAKIFKTKVEKFYLFFDPYFSIFKKKIGGTEYGIGWLPLGGYVKIAGMIDESMDKEQMAKPPQPWEFRSKPAWQRLIIMIGGVAVNVILAIVIYAGIAMSYGEDYLPNDNMVYGISTDSLGTAIGIEGGDKIVAIGSTKIQRYSDIGKEIILTDENSITVSRNGELKKLNFSDEQKGMIIRRKSRFILPRIPFVIGEITDTSAAKGILNIGDSIVGINGSPMSFYDQIIETVPNYANQELVYNIYRNGNRENLKVMVPKSGIVGIRAYGTNNYLDYAHTDYNFFEAIPKGLGMAKEQLVDYARQLGVIFTPETGAYKEVGGFIMIMDQFPSEWNWRFFWGFTAFLSIMLAFLNILPIPALDGGHVVFVLWEMISGRKPSQKVLEYSQVVGFIILLALILLVNGNDIWKKIFG